MNLIIGAILGFISVAFGAYAEHGLKSQISAEHFEFIMIAIRYNQIYAIVISGIGIALLSSKSLSRCLTLKLSNLFFIVGTILFSFSIYISVVYNIPIILKLAPFGGTTLMIGWLMLILAAVFFEEEPKEKLMKRYIITLALCIFVLSDTGFADTKDNQGYIVKLYFSRTMKDDKDNISYVSDKMFKNFENKYITPAFPDGYTENDARGYWRSPTGTTYSEKTKVVTILADDKSKQLEQK